MYSPNAEINTWAIFLNLSKVYSESITQNEKEIYYKVRTRTHAQQITILSKCDIYEFVKRFTVPAVLWRILTNCMWAWL